ncbi:MAG: hypothetical protein M1835_001767 [Candelina submexicana]|nr:MAG: hypothetical protein M1835_001767 [Candelina submexicana]
MPAPSVSIPPTIPSPLPSQLRSDINSALLTSGGIDRIHNQLVSSLEASGWTEAIRFFALERFREGGNTIFGEIMETVMREAISSGEEEMGKGKGKARVEEGKRLKVPDEVVKEGLRVVRRELEGIVEITNG